MHWCLKKNFHTKFGSHDNYCPKGVVITNNYCPRSAVITNNYRPRAVVISNNYCPRAAVITKNAAQFVKHSIKNAFPPSLRVKSEFQGDNGDFYLVREKFDLQASQAEGFSRKFEQSTNFRRR